MFKAYFESRFRIDKNPLNFRIDNFICCFDIRIGSVPPRFVPIQKDIQIPKSALMVNRIPDTMHGDWACSLWPEAVVTYTRNTYKFVAPNSSFKFDVILGKADSRLGTWNGYQDAMLDFIWIYSD